MNIKITYHIMPWEIDYALLTFTKLKQSKYFLSDEHNIIIDFLLNKMHRNSENHLIKI
jgi:hypothetical protein